MRCWARTRSIRRPCNDAAGRAALSELIGGFQLRQRSASFKFTSGVDERHRIVRFGWVMLDRDKRPLAEGFDIGELDDSGGLRRITGFFGPFPLVPESRDSSMVHALA